MKQTTSQMHGACVTFMTLCSAKNCGKLSFSPKIVRGDCAKILARFFLSSVLFSTADFTENHSSVCIFTVFIQQNEMAANLII